MRSQYVLGGGKKWSKNSAAADDDNIVEIQRTNAEYFFKHRIKFHMKIFLLWIWLCRLRAGTDNSQLIHVRIVRYVYLSIFTLLGACILAKFISDAHKVSVRHLIIPHKSLIEVRRQRARGNERAKCSSLCFIFILHQMMWANMIISNRIALNFFFSRLTTASLCLTLDGWKRIDSCFALEIYYHYGII